MAFGRVFVFILVCGAAAKEAGASCSSDGSCIAGSADAGEAQVEGSAMLHIRSVHGLRESLANRQHARQVKVVSSMECIDRVFAPFMSYRGWDGDAQLKGAMANAMAQLLTETREKRELDDVIHDLWSAHKDWYCAVANNSDCSIDGTTFDSMLEFTHELPEKESALIEHEQITTIERPQGKTTHADAARDVERAHSLPTESLTLLAETLQAWRKSGAEGSRMLRLAAAQIAEEARVLGLLQGGGGGGRGSLTQLQVALVKIVLAHHDLLSALGELPEVGKTESLAALSDLLLEHGACSDVSVANYPEMTIREVVQLMIHPYMQLHCAVTEDCTTTYTQAMLGAEAYGGTGLLQMAVGAMKKGGRLVVKSMVAAMMHLFGVEHFDGEVFEARSEADNKFDVVARAEDGKHLVAVRSEAAQLLQKQQLKGAGHAIWVLADLLQRPRHD